MHNGVLITEGSAQKLLGILYQVIFVRTRRTLLKVKSEADKYRFF